MPVQDEITIATYFAQKSEVVPHKYGAASGRHLEQAVEGLCVHDSCLSGSLSDPELLQECRQVPASEAFPANAHELPDLALSQALRPAVQPLLRLIHLVLTETAFFAYCESGKTSSRDDEQLDVDNIPDSAPFRNGRSFWYVDKTMQAEVQRQAVINGNRQGVLSVSQQAQWRITHLHVAEMALKLVAILHHAEAITALCALMANQLLSVAMISLQKVLRYTIRSSSVSAQLQSQAKHASVLMVQMLVQLIRKVLKQPTMPFAKYQANAAFIALGLLMPDEDDVLFGAVAAEYLKQGRTSVSPNDLHTLFFLLQSLHTGRLHPWLVLDCILAQVAVA